MIVDLFGNNRVPTPGGVNSIGGFNSYAAGNKQYGAGRSMPNIGPVMNTLGYSQRDNEAEARKNAILRRLQGTFSGNPMNSGIQNYTTGVTNGGF